MLWLKIDQLIQSKDVLNLVVVHVNLWPSATFPWALVHLLRSTWLRKAVPLVVGKRKKGAPGHIIPLKGVLAKFMSTYTG